METRVFLGTVQLTNLAQRKEYAIKKYSIQREKQIEKEKQVLSKKLKGYVPENGEGRSDEQVRIIAKNASAQNTGLNWITDARSPVS